MDVSESLKFHRQLDCRDHLHLVPGPGGQRLVDPRHGVVVGQGDGPEPLERCHLHQGGRGMDAVRVDGVDVQVRIAFHESPFSRRLKAGGYVPIIAISRCSSSDNEIAVALPEFIRYYEIGRQGLPVGYGTIAGKGWSW